VTNNVSAWSTRTGPCARRPLLAIPTRLTWKDAGGAVRFTSALAREVHDEGVVIECDSAVALPLYRLVHLQVEKTARDTHDLPAVLREGRVLAAVWKVGPCRPSTGTPGGYSLRFMVEPPSAEHVQDRRAS
jgi:hypothetical protein